MVEELALSCLYGVCPPGPQQQTLLPGAGEAFSIFEKYILLHKCLWIFPHCIVCQLRTLWMKCNSVILLWYVPKQTHLMSMKCIWPRKLAATVHIVFDPVQLARSCQKAVEAMRTLDAVIAFALTRPGLDVLYLISVLVAICGALLQRQEQCQRPLQFQLGVSRHRRTGSSIR